MTDTAAPTTDVPSAADLAARTAPVLATLTALRAGMPDVDDLPRAWTPRQVDAHEATRERVRVIGQGIHSTLGLMKKPTDRRDTRLPARTRLRAAQATLQQQHDAAGDYRLIADARERDKEWGRQQAIRASLKALAHGVEYFSGAPALPQPLRALLTDTCPTCQHETLHWQGSLADLDAAIAIDEKTLADLRLQLDAWLGQAATVISELSPAAAPTDAAVSS